MSKVVKKKVRRLKRTVRKTLGTLFLVSAIVIAAIPVDGLQAASPAKEEDWGTLKKNWPDSSVITASSIPTIEDGEPIYTTGDGIYQFAFVPPEGDSSDNKVAVLLGYTKSQTLVNGVLKIPDTVDAYAKYSTSDGNAEGGRCAVGRSNNFLFYVSEKVENPVYKLDDNGQVMKDEEGKDIVDHWVIDVGKSTFTPCYYDAVHREKWENLEDHELWYYPGGVNNGVPQGTPLNTSSTQFQRIKEAHVSYIGNQYLIEDKEKGEGFWKIGGLVEFKNRGSGVFANARNIVDLTMSKYMLGIGDYAFFGCANLESVKLENGLNTIGVGAFASCINLKKADIAYNALVSIIGDYAFYNCQKLSEFTVPVAVSIIGNSVFEDCIELEHVYLTGSSTTTADSKAMMLEEVGLRVFKNCNRLQDITFPETFKQNNVSLSVFDGCTALRFVNASNMNVNFVESDGTTFEAFKESHRKDFYFKGLKDSALHKTCTTEEIAFSFFDNELGTDLYELTKYEGEKKAVYRVDPNNSLRYCDLQTGLDTVTLPETIGPYGISSIGATTFQHNCALKMVTIPASVTSIDENAFRGCHNLKTVIFTDPSKVTSIGKGAFKTQEDVVHVVSPEWNCDKKTLDQNPVLYFVGPISNGNVIFEPFLYAMNPNENINNTNPADNQNRTYITYYSGAPSNLEVRYNPDTDKNELIGYPTLSALIASSTDEDAYTVDKYPYLTQEDITKMAAAANKYISDQNGSFSDPEKVILNSVFDIVLPTGIESVQEGLFRDKEKKEKPQAGIRKKTLTANSLQEVGDEMFDGCIYLKSITLSDATEKIGNYAFKNCTSLENVSIPATVKEMDVRPFVGCKALENVSFNGSPYFICDKSIIYELNSSGSKDKIVQCLEARAEFMVTAEETAGVTGIYPEAFMYAENVLSIDLSTSEISTVPEYALAYTPNLRMLTLPRIEPYMTIDKNALKNSGIQMLKIPGQIQVIDEEYLGDGIYYDKDDPNWSDKTNREVGGSGTDRSTDLTKLQEVVEEGSVAETVAKKKGIKYTNEDADIYYKITFYDINFQPLENAVDKAGRALENPQTVKAWGEVTEPVAPEVAGKIFTGWTPVGWQIATGEILNVYARYDDVVVSDKFWTVTFYDSDMATLIGRPQTVREGSGVNPPTHNNNNVKIDGWRAAPGVSFDLDNITGDLDLFAYYYNSPNGTGSGNNTDPNNPNNPDNPNGGTGSGNNTDPNNPNNPNNPDNPNGGTGSNNNTDTIYTLTVQNGTGSGSYTAGTQIIVSANTPARGQEFSSWTVSPAATVTTDKNQSSMIITMPNNDVAVIANFKVSTSNSSGSGSSNSANTNRPSGNAGTVGGTTVVIDKNGLSNTGVVSATVNGSSDNFTIKVTEDTSATEAILRALQAEYGSLDNIKYFPMDISLYDSTGTRKITDTTGLSVSITLPLPDSLIAYAGNNKVAGVVNDRLDKLSPRFTTINNVACVTFTAEHFSPYVIYVDVTQLSDGTISDNTPQTGDWIHPKWFLSIGLACLSFIMFAMKDNRKTPRKKQRVMA